MKSNSLVFIKIECVRSCYVTAHHFVSNKAERLGVERLTDALPAARLQEEDHEEEADSLVEQEEHRSTDARRLPRHRVGDVARARHVVAARVCRRQTQE